MQAHQNIIDYVFFKVCENWLFQSLNPLTHCEPLDQQWFR